MFVINKPQSRRFLGLYFVILFIFSVFGTLIFKFGPLMLSTVLFGLLTVIWTLIVMIQDLKDERMFYERSEELRRKIEEVSRRLKDD